MADLKTALNSLGLLLTIVGIVLLYLNSPLNSSTIDGGRADTDFAAIHSETAKRNVRMKVATVLVIIGTGVQLGSNFL